MENSELILDSAIDTVKLAGTKVLSFYGGRYAIHDKIDNFPVTQADFASNEVLLAGLSKTGYSILSEEGADDKRRLDSDHVWIIDPLDGTKDFIDETGEFTIMLGLVQKNKNNKYRPVLGVIYCPVSDTVYYALEGQGAFVSRKGGRPDRLAVSCESEWSKITMLTSRNHTTELEWQVAKALGISKVERFGSSLKACLIAEQAGHVNFNPSHHTWEWDVCASDIIIHEAGGMFTDIKGNLFNYNKEDPRNQSGYLASNGVIHGGILGQIAKSAD